MKLVNIAKSKMLANKYYHINKKTTTLANKINIL